MKANDARDLVKKSAPSKAPLREVYAQVGTAASKGRETLRYKCESEGARTALAAQLRRDGYIVTTEEVDGACFVILSWAD